METVCIFHENGKLYKAYKKKCGEAGEMTRGVKGLVDHA